MRNKNFIVSPIRNNDDNIKRNEKVTFILLAENYGYRMKSYGPISLIDIGGKTLLEHQVDAISSVFGNFEIIICSGFETHKVYHFVQSTFPRSFPIRIVENQVYYHSNCCEGVRLCMSNTRSDKIVICGGGVILTVPYLNSLDLRKSSILYQPGQKGTDFDIGIIRNQDRLENLSLAIKDNVWTDLLYLTGDQIIKSFYNIISKPELKNKFLFEAINTWRGRKNIYLSENKHDRIIKVDNLKTLKRIQKHENLIS